MAYTKGKWIYNYDRCAIESTSEFLSSSDDDDDKVPMMVVNLCGALGGDDSDADLKLICAAPDMFEALTEIARLLDEQEMNVDSFEFKLWTLANNALNF